MMRGVFKENIEHITLIRPPNVLPLSSITTSQGTPPIALAYLAGTLKKMGLSVTVIDAFGEAIHSFKKLSRLGYLVNGLLAEEIVARIPEKTDLIGFSCMYSNEWIYHKEVVNAAAEAFPDVPVIAGGEHVSAETASLFSDCPGLSLAVIGEGEGTLQELIETINEGGSLHGVAGLAFVDESGVLQRTERRARIKDLESIPHPDWEVIPLENYLDNGLGMGSVCGRNMPMIASRGCPYQCTFCSNAFMWTPRWYARDVDDLIAEIKKYKERYAITHIEFYDLTAIVQRDWIVRFTTGMIEEEINLTWSLPSGTRSEALDKEVLSLLYRAGCKTLTYAPESGSEETLKRIKKKADPLKLLSSMRSAVQVGMTIKANIVIGFPGQTLKEVRESFRYIVRMAWTGVHDVAVFPFVPYPGSELHRQLCEEGKINPQGKEYEAFLTGNVYNDVSSMRSWSEHISDKQLHLLSLAGMALFYSSQYLFRPWRCVITCYRIVTSTPYTMLERAVDGMIQNFLKGRKLEQN